MTYQMVAQHRIAWEMWKSIHLYIISYDVYCVLHKMYIQYVTLHNSNAPVYRGITAGVHRGIK